MRSYLPELNTGRVTAGLVLVLVLTTVILLSGRLSDVKLEQGAILVSDGTPTPGLELEDDLGERRIFFNIPLLDAIGFYARAVFWVLIPVTFFVFLFAPGSRWRRILTMLMSITGVLTAAHLLSRLGLGLGSTPLGDMDALPAQPLSGTPLVEPTTSEPSQALTYTVSFLLALVMIVIFGLIYRRLSSRKSSRDELVRQAEIALEEIESGAELAETVLTCYYRMTEILNQEAGIERRQGMTPREFEHNLQSAGVPYQDVKTLTRLFEKARYGRMEVGEEKRQSAVRSLSRIKQALGGDL